MLDDTGKLKPEGRAGGRGGALTNWESHDRFSPGFDEWPTLGCSWGIAGVNDPIGIACSLIIASAAFGVRVQVPAKEGRPVGKPSLRLRVAAYLGRALTVSLVEMGVL